MSCFSPILRPHGSGIPSEPVYFNDTTQKIVKSFMDLRYQLLPYIYTLTYEAHTDGAPIIRPLFYEFPEDSITYNIVNQYMFGESILVAPVIERGQKVMSVYLPAGVNWYNFWDNSKYKGGQWIDIETSLELIPVFIKAGSFIPMVPPVNSTVNYSSEKVTVRYYISEAESYNTGLMYEDDGETFRSPPQDSGYEVLSFNSISSEQTDIFVFESNDNNASLSFSERMINFEIIGLESMNFKTVQLEDAFGMNSIIGQKKNLDTDNWYLKNDGENTLNIRFDWEVNSAISISIHK